MNGQNEWVDKITCLTAINKSLMDTLLDVIELGCCKHEFASVQFNDEDAKILSNLVKTNWALRYRHLCLLFDYINILLSIANILCVKKMREGEGRKLMKSAH